VRRPDLVVALARDMIEAPQPMPCRRGAEVLGASRHSIWRSRMAIIGALKPEPDDTLGGIVEADEAHQRESRKGSREWVQHQRDPANHPEPPRLRWRAYLSAEGRRTKRTPRSHHINTVNALIGRFRAFLQPLCGPASKNLATYGRWYATRNNADHSPLNTLRLLLASGPRANTVC
jgi:hypothetical protein